MNKVFRISIVQLFIIESSYIIVNVSADIRLIILKSLKWPFELFYKNFIQEVRIHPEKKFFPT